MIDEKNKLALLLEFFEKKHLEAEGKSNIFPDSPTLREKYGAVAIAYKTGIVAIKRLMNGDGILD